MACIRTRTHTYIYTYIQFDLSQSEIRCCHLWLSLDTRMREALADNVPEVCMHARMYVCMYVYVALLRYMYA